VGESAKLGGTAKMEKAMSGWTCSFVSLVLLASAATAVVPAEPPAFVRAFDHGDYPRARALAAERLRAAPGDVPARILLARAEAAMGRFEAAYAGFREAQRRDPRNPDALYYLGITAGVLAQVEYDRLLATAPRSARAHQLRGQTYSAQGRTSDAQREFEAALAAGPPSADVLVALGDLERRQLNFAAARAHYARAAELAPSSYDALYGLGVCDSYAGEHAKAIESFRRALGVDPDSAPARLALGISLLQTGQAAAAVTELEQAARLEPRMRQAQYQLGRAYQALGRPSESQAAFARAQELLQQERQADQEHPDLKPESPE
jgi:tetratricopeptide (TPR) repeat protein